MAGGRGPQPHFLGNRRHAPPDCLDRPKEPITDQTDTPGPIARTVTDAAILLTVIAGMDAEDDTTNEAADLAGADFTDLLDAEALQEVRVGILTGAAAPLEGMSNEDFFGIIGIAPAIAGLEAAGAEIVPIWDTGLDNTELFVVLGNNGLRLGFADYIAAVGPERSISSIADVVTFNDQDPERNAFYGQERLEAAATSDGTREEYEGLGSQLRDEARGHIADLLEGNDIDVIAAPSNKFSGVYAVAGYPTVTVPAGLRPTGEAIGLTFTGDYLEDAQVLAYAYAFEQASQLREVPPAGAVE
jgi:amidase